MQKILHGNFYFKHAGIDVTSLSSSCSKFKPITSLKYDINSHSLKAVETMNGHELHLSYQVVRIENRSSLILYDYGCS